MERGVVSKVIIGRNYGFIRHPVTKTEYFFHRDDFNGHWGDLEAEYGHRNLEVDFEISESPKGPRACNVTRTELIY